MKRILIPVDLTIHCYEAIEYTVEFFRYEKCEFYFLNTYNYDVDGLNAIHLLQADDDYFEKAKSDSEFCLGRVVENFASRSGGNNHFFSAISERAILVDGIKKTVKDLEIDMVVLAGEKKNNGESSEKYSRDTKRILDNIRECPVMIIPAATKLHKKPEFLLVSNFEQYLPEAEIGKWYELVRIANGTAKVVCFEEVGELSGSQITNLDRLKSQLKSLSGNSVEFEFIENLTSLKDYAADHEDYIICLMDRKPDFWRKCGIKHSKITNIGPIPGTPIIALHR